jgi:hypothetical protein
MHIRTMGRAASRALEESDMFAGTVLMNGGQRATVWT